jgi:hypothetical protein
MFDRQDLIPEEEIRSSEQEPHAESADADRNQPMLAGMRCDLRGWGIALIGIGIAQYFIPFLDSMWAFVVVPLGALSLFLAHRGLFIAIGTALVNILGGTRDPQVRKVRRCEVDKCQGQSAAK